MYNFKLPEDPKFLEIMDLQLNKINWLKQTEKEIKALKPIIGNLNPNVVVDWGCGLGRSAISFYHNLGWQNTKFKMCDKTGIEKNIEGRKWIDDNNKQVSSMGSFSHSNSIPYNDLNLTKKFCEINDLSVETYDIDKIRDLGSPDIFYSMHCVGYHFSIKSFLDKVTLTPNVMIFGIRKKTQKLNEDEKNHNCFDVNNIIGYDMNIVSGYALQDYVVFTKE